MTSNIVAALTACALLTSACAQAEQEQEKQQDYGRLAQLTVQAWDCFSHTSSDSKDQKIEQERLFKLGYQSGIKFLNAVKAEKVSAEAWRSQVPLYWRLTMEGPSEDFVLGRLFESIQNDSGDKLVEENLNVDLWPMWHEQKLREGNCGLLKE